MAVEHGTRLFPTLFISDIRLGARGLTPQPGRRRPLAFRCDFVGHYPREPHRPVTSGNTNVHHSPCRLVDNTSELLFRH